MQAVAAHLWIGRSEIIHQSSWGWTSGNDGYIVLKSSFQSSQIECVFFSFLCYSLTTLVAVRNDVQSGSLQGDHFPGKCCSFAELLINICAETIGGWWWFMVSWEAAAVKLHMQESIWRCNRFPHWLCTYVHNDSKLSSCDFYLCNAIFVVIKVVACSIINFKLLWSPQSKSF